MNRFAAGYSTASWLCLQKSADLIKELHAVVSRHADTIESQQVEICRFESVVSDWSESCASVQRECDDAVNEMKRLQQKNNQLIAQQQSHVATSLSLSLLSCCGCLTLGS